MLTFLNIAGGVALILFGVRYLNKGLDRLFGPRLGAWMHRMAGNDRRAFFAGLLISITAPSSTTMSVLGVQGVRSGHLTARQMMILMLGANIGLTVAVQLIALDIVQFAPIFILVGVGLFQFTKGRNSRGIGQLILSLGFVFLAMGIISQACDTAAFEPGGDMAQLVSIANRHPLPMAILAALLTVALQSSRATIGLIIALGAAGAVSFQVSIIAVIGANIGLSLTTAIVGWNQVEGRTLALGNLVLKLLLAAPALWLVEPAADLFQRLPGTEGNQIAHAHSAYNIVLAIIGWPLAGIVVSAVERLAPASADSGDADFKPKHITGTFPEETPGLGLALSMREILRMSEIVRTMLDDIWVALRTSDEALARSVGVRDDQVDLLDSAIKRYLAKLGGKDVAESEAEEQMLQLRYLNELETIGDIIDKNLSELVLKRIDLRAQFSSEGWKELNDFHALVSEDLIIADTVFMTRDKDLARKLLGNKERLSSFERSLRDRHFARLRDDEFHSHETSAIHLDLLTHLKQVNSSASHVAYEVLQKAPDEG